MARWLGVPAGPLLDAAAPVRIVMGDGADEWVEVHVLTADPPHLLERAAAARAVATAKGRGVGRPVLLDQAQLDYTAHLRDREPWSY